MKLETRCQTTGISSTKLDKRDGAQSVPAVGPSGILPDECLHGWFRSALIGKSLKNSQLSSAGETPAGPTAGTDCATAIAALRL